MLTFESHVQAEKSKAIWQERVWKRCQEHEACPDLRNFFISALPERSVESMLMNKVVLVLLPTAYEELTITNTWLQVGNEKNMKAFACLQALSSTRLPE